MAAGLVEFKPLEAFRQDLLKPQVRHTDKPFEEIEEEMEEVIAAFERNSP